MHFHCQNDLMDPQVTFYVIIIEYKHRQNLIFFYLQYHKNVEQLLSKAKRHTNNLIHLSTKY